MRARELGIRIGDLSPGALDAITDVEGVRVGHSTIVRGEGPLVVGEGPVRTGVTVVCPRQRLARDEPVFAGSHTFNGNGEMTGLEWIREAGILATPVAITNTHSVGVVRDALVRAEMEARTGEGDYWCLPVVAETYDGTLNDINGMHVTTEHLFEALDSASSGPVEEGSVGAGTGSIIVVLATDAPLLPTQCDRLARRASIGLGRMGGSLDDGSGDIFFAFATGNRGLPYAALGKKMPATVPLRMLPNERMTPLFYAAAEVTEAAILNALLAAGTVTGRDGITAHGLAPELLLGALDEPRPLC